MQHRAPIEPSKQQNTIYVVAIQDKDDLKRKWGKPPINFTATKKVATLSFYARVCLNSEFVAMLGKLTKSFKGFCGLPVSVTPTDLQTYLTQI